MDGQTPEAPALTGLDKRIDALKEAGVLDGAGLLHEPGTGHFATASQREQVIAHADQILDRLDGSQVVDQGDLARQTQQAEREAARKKAVLRMARALTNGKISEYSAGPDYIKATGLSHENVQRLGFSGFADLADAGRAKNAERAERQARIAELTAKQAERNERKAAARAWRDELDANNAARDAGAKRVEGITYRLMLGHGGELGLKRNPELAEQLRKEAIARAKAEGHNVSDMEPRYYPVPDKTSKTAQDTVDALERFDAAMYGSQQSGTESDGRSLSATGIDAGIATSDANKGKSQQKGTMPTLSPEILERALEENERYDQLARELPAVQEGLSQAMQAYASVTAEQRNSHHGRIQGKGFMASARAFLRGLSKRRSDTKDALVAKRRDEYRMHLSELTGMVQEHYGITGKNAHIQVVYTQANWLVALEASIFDQRTKQANKSHLAQLNTFLATQWEGKSKLRKYAVVAALPFVAGAYLGLVAAAMPLAAPASIAAAIGVGYGGRKLGQAHARSVNKGRVNLMDTDAEVGKARNWLNGLFEQGLMAVSESGIDIAEYTEQRTTEEVLANQTRRHKIGAVAATAAGVGFAAGRIAGGLAFNHGSAPSGGEQADPGNGVTSGGEHSGIGGNAGVGGELHTTVTTYGDGFSTNNYPWDVANHYVGADNAMDTVSRAVHTINGQVAGSPYSLHHVGSNLEVYRHGHAMSAAAQQRFNGIMVQALKLQ